MNNMHNNLQTREINRIHFPKAVSEITSLVTVEDKIFYVDNRTIYFFIEKFNVVHEPCYGLECITDLVYLNATDELWFGTGDQYVYLNPHEVKVTVAEAGEQYLNATWSPNQEFIVICGVDGTVTCCRDKYRNFVPVSFTNQLNEPLAKDTANLDIRISWKENSQYFCVSYFDEGYKLRIYSAEGEIINAKIEIPHMQPHITWRDGMIICAIQDNCHRFWIGMYEINGLYHSNFCLDEKVKSVNNMKWNAKGDLLAIHTSTEDGSFLDIYTHAHYSFVLKQQLVYSNKNRLSFCNVSESSEYIANIIVTNTKSIISYKFMYEMQYGELPNGDAFSAVTDGNLLKFLRTEGHATVEVLQVIECPNVINTVIFNYTFSHCLIVDSYINIYVYTFEDSKFTKIKEKLSIDNETSIFMPSDFYNLCFTTQDRVCTSSINSANIHDLYELDMNTLELLPCNVGDNNTKMIYVHEYKKLITLRKNGCLFLGDVQINQLLFKVTKMTYAIINDELYIFILDSQDQLHVNNSIILKGVSSFIIHAQYLYVTTFQKSLISIHLIPNNMQRITNKDTLKLCMYTRSCEDGLTLLCGAPTRKHIFLQHTRGNTEMILCRNVAINELRDYVQAGMWKAAYELVRMERLDFNLLVDLNPNVFISNIEDIIQSIESPNLIETFILNLKDENVLLTTYKSITNDNIHKLDKKKEQVCKSILDAIKYDMKVYIRVAILASYVVGGVAAAIEILHHLYCTYGDVSNVIKNGVDCLKLYVVSNDICKACLYKINIDFAKCIIEKLNIDPKIHEQLFNEIKKQNFDVNRQYFIVHHFLENYKEALYYLLASCMFLRAQSENYDFEDDINTMIKYAQTHGLVQDLYKYAHTLDLYDKKIITEYANTLLRSNRVEEAAMIFAANSMWKEALDSYIKCRMWQDALYAMKQLGVNETGYVQNLAKSLDADGKYKDAAHLYEKYLSKIDLAVQSLVAGKFLKEAVHCCRTNSRQDIFESVVRPEYTTYRETLMDKIQVLNTTFSQYSKRLQVIRETDLASIPESERYTEGITTDYAESIISSVNTTWTWRTSPSSTGTNRSRKEEKKKLTLREGGVYENIGLLRALHDIIRESYNLSTDVRDILSLFMLYEQDGMQYAKSLQDAYSELLEQINTSLSSIWPLALNTTYLRLTTELALLRRNIDRLDMQYRYAPEPVPTNWRFGILDEVVINKDSSMCR